MIHAGFFSRELLMVLWLKQVLLILHAEIFDKIPFFKDKHPQFLEQLIPHLKLEVRC